LPIELTALPADATLVEFLATPRRVLAAIVAPGERVRWVNLGSRAPLASLLEKLSVLLAGLRDCRSAEERRRLADA
jgi:hypothetical protein